MKSRRIKNYEIAFKTALPKGRVILAFLCVLSYLLLIPVPDCGSFNLLIFAIWHILFIVVYFAFSLLDLMLLVFLDAFYIFLMFTYPIGMSAGVVDTIKFSIVLPLAQLCGLVICLTVSAALKRSRGN